MREVNVIGLKPLVGAGFSHFLLYRSFVFFENAARRAVQIIELAVVN